MMKVTVMIITTLVMRTMLINTLVAKMPDAAASVPGNDVNMNWVNRTLRSLHCLGSGVTQMPSDIPSNTAYLEIKNTRITEIPQEALTRLLALRRLVISENSVLKRIGALAFAGLPQLDMISISENGVLETIGASAFSNLPKLTELIITNSKHLRAIHEDAFLDLPKLQKLTIANTGLEVLPNLTKINSTASGFLFHLQDNIHIARIPANAFRGLCTQTITEIQLTGNGIREVASDAFNGTKMYRLLLKDNQKLATIDADAFAGSSGLVALDISNTAVSSLPESILGGLKRLTAVSVVQLRELPPPQLFTKLRWAHLTYPSHCCPFRNAQRNSSWRNPMCSDPGAQDEIGFYTDQCSNITCSPADDAFNPCEDIMAFIPLRVLIWVISILALLGNTAVLLVLLGSQAKLTVPRFFMCHLAFADLCMGIYLMVIAIVDMLTRGRYYSHAIDWQTGQGCSTAGFFTVFASELSVFTLTAITVERWHTITHALRVDRKLRLRHACVVMTAGWAFSFLAALLPTVGVSSYEKVSICLPMDVESLRSQVYVVCLLLLNVVAFICVCGCYLSIYLTVCNPASAPAHADTRVAQRMAVLIFTDFLCMAPISFFAISAAFKLPLITVSHAKLLLVLFYPINSCSNPFLYAFFTRNFRRDFFLLAACFGLCKVRAQIYRTESTSGHHPAWISPKSSQGTPYHLGNISR